MTAPTPWMELALAEAARAAHVSPNPAVGCVIVAEGKVVGRGFTQPPGSAHAEVLALREAGERARGATLYVTLEPCSHWGRTPPCADAVIEAGIAELHCAVLDADPRVRGGGVRRLRDAGVRVTVGDGEAEAERGLAAYLTHRLTGRPLVTAKFAASLDGKIATRTGDARWISGQEARERTRQERGAFDAILVGVGTVLADDPQLTARGPDGSLCTHQPLRVVLDSTGRTPATAHVLEPPARTLLASTERSSAEWRALMAHCGAEVCVLPEDGGRVDVAALLDELGRRDLLSLLVEGGGAVHGSFFDARLVDRVQAILAPLVIGGAAAPPAVGGDGPAALADATRLLDVGVEQVGADVFVTGATRPTPLLRSGDADV
jgi:diaminohydroxyphosphoribosylaminopyrimidine deaminase/5-amino-6-(5-phosphoribosylamino)uracil reductase